MRYIIKHLAGGPSPADAVVVFAAERDAAILESVSGHPRWGRHSVFASDPVEVVEVGAGTGIDPFVVLADRFRAYPAMEPRPQVPFVGGWIGYLAYEAGLGIEKIVPIRPAVTTLPRVRMGLYDAAAVYDHQVRTWSLVAVEWPPGATTSQPSAGERIDRLQRLLEGAGSVRSGVGKHWAGTPQPDWTRQEYRTRVAAIQESIAAGDVYQVNLTQRFVARTAAVPLDLYLALRCCNPADYAALLAWEGRAVISSSPELFLELRDGRALSRPIKGTRPRSGDPALDAVRRKELATSAKDEAELNMIVDVIRNDLGKVCAYGTVRVESAGDIEDHPTVFHRVATVSGRPRSGFGAIDLLRAAFPGGSVTGAPKIRAMQIINELEAAQRGVYCGAIGYIGLDGSMRMNIAIRTMILDRGVVHIHAGGGVVADSDAEEEYEEMLAKAEGMFRALRAVNQDSSEGAEAQRFE